MAMKRVFMYNVSGWRINMLPRKSRAKQYRCNLYDHPWCSAVRGTACEHSGPHRPVDGCHKECRPCICWGVPGPIAGNDERLVVKCKEVK